MHNTEASYRTYWATLTDRSEREVYVPEALRPQPETPLAVGDRIRILEDGLDFATVEKGDVLTVVAVTDTHFDTNAPRLVTGGEYWIFPPDDEGTGWERVS